MSRRAPRLSVVIPTLDESEWLGALLGDIAELAGPHERRPLGDLPSGLFLLELGRPTSGDY